MSCFRHRRRWGGGLACVLAFIVAAVTLLGQQNGPIRPPATSPRRIPLHPSVPPPPLPLPKIIQTFTANETANAAAFENFDYRESILVEEFARSGGGPTGMFRLTLALTKKPDGHRYGRLLEQSPSTLQLLRVDADDLRALADLPLFPLTANQASQYQFTYRGTEKLDQLETFIFEVEPKEDQEAGFAGLVWVDQTDLVIVKTYGRFGPARPEGSSRLPFFLWESYRENLFGKTWFPTYLRSDDVVRQQGAELPVRLIIRLQDFHAVARPFPVQR